MEDQANQVLAAFREPVGRELAARPLMPQLIVDPFVARGRASRASTVAMPRARACAYRKGTPALPWSAAVSTEAGMKCIQVIAAEALRVIPPSAPERKGIPVRTSVRPVCSLIRVCPRRSGHPEASSVADDLHPNSPSVDRKRKRHFCLHAEYLIAELTSPTRPLYPREN